MGMRTRWTLCYYPDNAAILLRKRYVERTFHLLPQVGPKWDVREVGRSHGTYTNFVVAR